MTLKGKTKNKRKVELHGIDPGILGKIMTAQNVSFVLPTNKNIAEYYAELLYSIPGISACRVCLGGTFSTKGNINKETCRDCNKFRVNNEGIPYYSKDFECKLNELPDSYILVIKSIDHRFGFFIFILDNPSLFDLYKPFLYNLGNFVALTLENRLQKNHLQNAHDVLENKVKERTTEIQSINTSLKEEIEERKRTEDALRDSEEQFRFLFDTMVQGVVIQDSGSKIVDANEAACEILGLTREQILGKTTYDPRWKLIHEDGSPLPPEKMPSNIALRSRKPVTDVLIGAYIPEKDTYHWILTSSTPKFKNGSSRPYLTMTTFSDITKQKGAEAELKEQFSTLRSIIDSTNALIFSIDKKYRYTSFNKGHAEVMKAIYDADIEIGHNMLNYMTVKEDREKAKQNLDRALNGEQFIEESYSGEENLSRQYFQVSHSPIKTETGKVIGVAVFAQDRTEQMQNEAINSSRLYLIQFSLTHTLYELLEETLNETEKLTHSLIGFYHFVEDDQKTLSLQNWSTRTKKEFCKAKGKGLHYDIANAGVWVECVYQQKPVIHNDYASLPNRRGMPEGHAPVIRELVVPVFRGEKIVAILGVGNKASNYTEKDVETVSLLADLTWEIAERKRAEKEVHKGQQMFRALVENSSDIIARYDRDCKCTYVNPVYIKESKIPKEELIGATPLERSLLQSESAVLLENLLHKVVENGTADSIDVLWQKEDNIDYWFNVHASPEYDHDGKVMSVITTFHNITSRKQAEQERLKHLRFLESLDIVNRTIQKSDNLEQMMSDVLDNVLKIFNCDRAFLMYPCDPNATIWTAPMERNKPEYPGVNVLGLEMNMDDDVAETLRILLSSDGPVQFGPGTQYPLPTDVSKQFGFKSFMSMAIYPKTGRPWQFGIHQCSYAHIWTPEEERLFQEIGRRMADGMTSLLSYRNLFDSEQRYRMVFENSPVSIWEEDFSEIKTFFDDLKKQGINDLETYLNEHPEAVSNCAELVKIINVNHSALVLHAAKSKQELMENLINVFTPESFNTFKQELVCLWNGMKEMKSDGIVKTLTGEHRNVTVLYSVCPGHEETLSKVLVSLIDITERKRIEEALYSSEAELRTLINAMTDVIFVSNSEGRYLKIADTSPSLLYKPSNELLGKTLHEVFPKEQADFFLNYIRQTLNTQKSVNFEYSLPIGSKEIWFNATISPMSDDKILMVARDITDRKQSEEALKNTAHRLNEAQRLAHIGNWELDLINNVLTWSDEIYKMFRIDPQKFGATYEAFLDTIHPDDRDAVNFAYTNSLKTKSPYAIDHRLLFPDGQIRYVHEQCETFYDEDKPIRSIGTVQDITDRKQAEEELQKTNDLLHTIIEAAPTAIIGLDLEGKVQSIWNHAAEKLLGWSAKEAMGSFLPSVPVDKKEEFKRFREWIKSGKTLNGVEVKRQKRDGTPIDYSIYASPLYDSTREIIGNIAVLVDITERKRMEEELTRYREHLEELVKERTEQLEIAKNKAQQYLDIAGVILVAIDANRKITLINQKGCEILGRNVNEIIGKDWFETFIPENIRSDVIRAFHQLVSGDIKPIEYFENPILTPNGEERLIAWHNVLLKDSAGKVIGTLSSGEDITEQKHAETQIMKLNQDLQERARALEAANKELEAFSYSVSHDLRAPLRAIDGFSQVLMEEYLKMLNERGQNYLLRIRAAAQRMGQLIDDILNLSRINRSEMNIRNVDLSMIAREVANELDKSQPDRNVEVIIQEKITAKGDKRLLRILMENLIENAWKFTSKHPRALIEIGKQHQENKIVYFVRDDGAGFDMKYAQRLFGAFQRLHTTSEFPGTGIGLATVQRIINKHGGVVWAESEVEKGTTIYFTLS